MRLKFLFFPFILVLSLVIMAVYVWPELQAIGRAKSSRADSTKILENIKKNQSNIKSLNADLDANADKTNFVLTYFPQTRNEEKVVDALNYLATGAGLSVINIGLDKEAAPLAATPLVSQSAPLTSLAKQGEADPAPAAETANAGPLALEVKNIVAQVTVTGEYEKILMYIDQLQKLGLYGKITKAKIATQPEAGTQAESGPANQLKAELAVTFNYAPALKKVGSENANFSNARFDFAPVDKLQNLITQGGAPSPLPQIQADSAGKTNPFLP